MIPRSIRWISLLIAFIVHHASSVTAAFQSHATVKLCMGGRPSSRTSMLTTNTDTSTATSKKGNPSPSGACYYKRADGPWRPRKELQKLFIGERLFATRLPSSDLLNAKTGPKAFLECGVGRINDKGEWSIVNGMIRIGRRGMKPSVVRKKINKMPPNTLVEVYVSKIRLDNGSFEVCLDRDEALERGSQEMNSRVSASTLKPGEELTGFVKKVTPYGVFVDVNANRNGLLHISKVAKQQDTYIDKEDGLKKIGLGRGSPVNVVVVSNDKKRLEFDIAPPPSDVDEDDDDDSVTTVGDIADDEAAMWAAYAAPESTTTEEKSKTNDDISDDEAAMWAAYAAPDAEDKSEASDIGDDEAAMWAAYANSNSGDEDDEYDEDTDIEDALGIGYY